MHIHIYTPTPVFLPGESHGQRSLVGCSPWGCTELDTTEATWQHTYIHAGVGGEIIFMLCLDFETF